MCRHWDGAGAEEQRDNRMQGVHADGQRVFQRLGSGAVRVGSGGSRLQEAPLPRLEEWRVAEGTKKLWEGQKEIQTFATNLLTNEVYLLS